LSLADKLADGVVRIKKIVEFFQFETWRHRSFGRKRLDSARRIFPW
jgi:hypothetical protein